MSKRIGIVAELALWDLCHEWILTLCLVLAIAAVIAPLLLLLGLKHGTIATLRHRLVEDPVYREIKPAQTREYPMAWFDRLNRREAVNFLTPTILPASSIIMVVHPHTGRTEMVDLIPTAPGDPLILENGGRIPEGDQCVLTGAAAEDLDVSVGDVLKVRATRSNRGQREFGEAALEVVSLLGPRAGGLPRIYAPLDFVLNVEDYKEGMGVPSRGWPGGSRVPYLSYDGFLLVLPRVLSPVEESGLIINTGLTSVNHMERSAFAAKSGFPLPDHLHAYDLKAAQNPVHLSSYDVLRNRLRGKGAVLLPYAAGIQVRIPDGGDMAVFGLSLSALQAEVLGLPPLPWGEFERSPSSRKLQQILLPHGMAKGETLFAEAGGGEGSLVFPLVNRGTSFTDFGVVPVELIGVLRTARNRGIEYDAAQGGFLISRRGFRGFRLYARSIDDVVPLVRELEKDGIEVIAQIEPIERVRVLDRGLTNLFWLVAVVGITGGIAALIASLYAAVERKKPELSVMRLIGLSRPHVFLFPLYQGGSMAFLSMMAAMVGYLALARVINRAFAGDLGMGERICELPFSYLMMATGATLVVAIMSSLLAAWRTTRIDPSEALRYE